MVNSKAKGSSGEREAAQVFRSCGFDARRSQQYMGTADSSDLLCEELSEFNIEVKRCQNTALEAWLLKAKEDAPEKTPMICHRRNGEKWKITMQADELLCLLRGLIPLAAPAIKKLLDDGGN